MIGHDPCLLVTRYRVKVAEGLVAYQRRELRRIEKGVNKVLKRLEQWEQKKKQ